MKKAVLALILCSMAFHASSHRLVALSPHLTEWVYSLGHGDDLVAASAFSDYPADATRIEQIADYQGVNLSRLVQLEPSLVLVWRGGNKPQDIARIKKMGLPVFESSPEIPEDIADEILQLGKLLGSIENAHVITKNFLSDLSKLRRRYQKAEHKKAFYYTWQHPLMSIGKNTWANRLLNTCNIESVFADSVVDYPSVSMQQVIKKQPHVIISATGTSAKETEDYWLQYKHALDADIYQTNPDIMSRFTVRIADELSRLCHSIHRSKTSYGLIRTSPIDSTYR